MGGTYCKERIIYGFDKILSVLDDPRVPAKHHTCHVHFWEGIGENRRQHSRKTRLGFGDYWPCTEKERPPADTPCLRSPSTLHEEMILIVACGFQQLLAY